MAKNTQRRAIGFINDKLLRIWKKAVNSYFEPLSRNSCGVTE